MKDKNQCACAKWIPRKPLHSGSQRGLKQRMDLATIENELNLSEYAELAIENQLKKDKIP